MKFSISASTSCLLLGVFTLSGSQVLGVTASDADSSPQSLPSCAESCVGTSFSKSGCALLDMQCICADKKMASTMSDCLTNACSKNDQQTTINFVSSICKLVKSWSSISASTSTGTATSSSFPSSPLSLSSGLSFSSPSSASASISSKHTNSKSASTALKASTASSTTVSSLDSLATSTKALGEGPDLPGVSSSLSSAAAAASTFTSSLSSYAASSASASASGSSLGEPIGNKLRVNATGSGTSATTPTVSLTGTTHVFTTSGVPVSAAGPASRHPCLLGLFGICVAFCMSFSIVVVGFT
ncbi:hypothetical protein L228DRAFT_100462 [Xylona heveae TC161]|uniref:CFEM domain-containing protein n=1 Tax=Xylona heveae (strain CBS 132557 / TC161) TaxID=1328760 RepID=A0A165IAC3_XYLHT|nr:hypothetical protein L228DRAFT_100462 [Xylona heveae TC161]KZF24620.1 hypothetical protein L228DRAFT_100462 [Xylona heveae TC161]